MSDDEVQLDVLGELSKFAEHLQPVYDLAEGQRAELERRGWSPTIAEATAAAILNALIMSIFRGRI